MAILVSVAITSSAETVGVCEFPFLPAERVVGRLSSEDHHHEGLQVASVTSGATSPISGSPRGWRNWRRWQRPALDHVPGNVVARDVLDPLEPRIRCHVLKITSNDWYSRFLPYVSSPPSELRTL